MQRGSSSWRRNSIAASHLVEDQLEPQLRDLVLDDEQQLVVLGRGADRLLRAEQLVELQVSLVANLAVRAGSRLRRGLLLIDLRARFSCHFFSPLAGRATARSKHYNPAVSGSARLWPRSAHSVKIWRDSFWA